MEDNICSICNEFFTEHAIKRCQCGDYVCLSCVGCGKFHYCGNFIDPFIITGEYERTMDKECGICCDEKKKYIKCNQCCHDQCRDCFIKLAEGGKDVMCPWCRDMILFTSSNEDEINEIDGVLTDMVNQVKYMNEVFIINTTTISSFTSISFQFLTTP